MCTCISTNSPVKLQGVRSGGRALNHRLALLTVAFAVMEAGAAGRAGLSCMPTFTVAVPILNNEVLQYLEPAKY